MSPPINIIEIIISISKKFLVTFPHFRNIRIFNRKAGAFTPFVFTLKNIKTLLQILRERGNCNRKTFKNYK